MAFRQHYVPISHGLRPSVQRREIRPLDTSHKTPPGLGFLYAIQVQRILGIVAERRRDPHLVRFQPRLVIQIIQSVVWIIEFRICAPYVGRRPVIQWRSGPNILELAGYPA